MLLLENNSDSASSHQMDVDYYYLFFFYWGIQNIFHVPFDNADLGGLKVPRFFYFPLHLLFQGVSEGLSSVHRSAQETWCVWCWFSANAVICLRARRGKGPLKNSSDVINAAKKIAEAGSRMDKLARAVADQVRDN